MPRPKLADRTAVTDVPLTSRFTAVEIARIKVLLAQRLTELRGTGATLNPGGLVRAIVVRELDRLGIEAPPGTPMQPTLPGLNVPTTTATSEATPAPQAAPTATPSSSPTSTPTPTITEPKMPKEAPEHATATSAAAPAAPSRSTAPASTESTGKKTASKPTSTMKPKASKPLTASGRAQRRLGAKVAKKNAKKKTPPR